MDSTTTLVFPNASTIFFWIKKTLVPGVSVLLNSREQSMRDLYILYNSTKTYNVLIYNVRIHIQHTILNRPEEDLCLEQNDDYIVSTFCKLIEWIQCCIRNSRKNVQVFMFVRNTFQIRHFFLCLTNNVLHPPCFDLFVSWRALKMFILIS